MNLQVGGQASLDPGKFIFRRGEDSGDIGVVRFATIAAQLGVLLVVVYVYQLEQAQAFSRILLIIFAGFCLHAWLPLRYRIRFFLLLSFAAVVAVMGALHGLLLIAIGLVLFAICHLPVAFWLRISLLSIAAIVLAAVRGEWIPTPPQLLLPTMVLPILGAIFMFRIIIYMYDLRHEKSGSSWGQRLAYFFMLPNVCFPLFPVVDYQRFMRTYYDRDAGDIYQQGIVWMFRGVTHLLLYRIIYHHFTLAPSDVEGLWGVLQYMLATYLLYLRISGQFHLIIGIMCLFGFNLPETHHLYYLASSFNDYWRRINIYWKDFMLKIFYYPSLMRLRRWGMTTALVLSTFVVFFSTWLLHGYQWFWLRGTFPVTAPDLLFWGILGGLVVVNSLLEAKRARKRMLHQKGFEPAGAFAHSLKVVGMFVFITVLWSLWSSPTVGAWLGVVGKMNESSAFDILLLFGGLGLLVVFGVLIQLAKARRWLAALPGMRVSFGRSVATTAAGLIVLVVLARPGLQTSFDGRTAAALVSMTNSGFNQQDDTDVERGYYEGLLNTEKLTSALMMVQSPKDWKNIRQAGIVLESDDVLNYQLLPSLDVSFKRVPFRTNRWGLRDKEYEQEKPRGAYRIIMLGSSYAMGAGVENEGVFEALLEERLQREHGGADFETYEILNFSVGAYSVLHNAVIAQRFAFSFNPNAVFVVLHSTEKLRLLAHLRELIERDVLLEDPNLAKMVQTSGARSGMSKSEIEALLEPHLQDIVEWSLGEIVGQCRRNNVLPVAVLIPTVSGTDWKDEELASIELSARDAGLSIVDLKGVFDGQDRKAMLVAPWDTHPSALAHRLIADRMYEALLETTLIGGLLNAESLPGRS